MEKHLEPSGMLSLRDTAELLEVTPRAVQVMIRRHKFPAKKIRGQWRVRTSELAKWIHALEAL